MASPVLAKQIDESENFRKKLKSIVSGFDVESLSSAGLTPELNFAEGRPYFSGILNMFRDLSDRDLSALPIRKLADLQRTADETGQLLIQIHGFNIQQYPTNATQMRINFLTQVQEQYGKVFDLFAPLLAYTVPRTDHILSMQAEISKILVEIEDGRNKQLSIVEEMETMLRKARQTVGEIGIVGYAQIFADEAKAHRRSATKWLAAAAVLAASTVALASYGYWQFFYHPPQLTPLQAVQLSIAKIVILSMFISATLWMAKTYRSHEHNYVVNKHRHNALRSFETFVKSASADADTKNAVLIQATKCVFSPQASGYFTQESEPVSGPQILEIVRGLSGK